MTFSSSSWVPMDRHHAPFHSRTKYRSQCPRLRDWGTELPQINPLDTQWTHKYCHAKILSDSIVGWSIRKNYPHEQSTWLCLVSISQDSLPRNTVHKMDESKLIRSQLQVRMYPGHFESIWRTSLQYLANNTGEVTLIKLSWLGQCWCATADTAINCN